MKPKRTNRQSRKQVHELQSALELSDFYAFMLTFPVHHQKPDDQTIQCIIACVNKCCSNLDCFVYAFCPMKEWRISMLS